MKQIRTLIFTVLITPIAFVACNTGAPKVAGTDTTATSNITLPYTANYTSNWTYDVSDSDLLLVLNSYKYWETGDLNSLRSTMGDSMNVNASNGWKFSGLSDSLLTRWQTSRDSLSSVSISMDAWEKNHSVKDGANYITVWYKEIDTYKTGKVDSANYADINQVKDGKITWFSQYKQALKQ